MSTTRRRRIHAHTKSSACMRSNAAAGATAPPPRVNGIQHFDDTLAKLMAWVAIAVFVLIATLVVIA